MVAIFNMPLLQRGRENSSRGKRAFCQVLSFIFHLNVMVPKVRSSLWYLYHHHLSPVMCSLVTDVFFAFPNTPSHRQCQVRHRLIQELVPLTLWKQRTHGWIENTQLHLSVGRMGSAGLFPKQCCSVDAGAVSGMER